MIPIWPRPVRGRFLIGQFARDEAEGRRIGSEHASICRDADADRQWFHHRPDRRHRARYATTTERRAFGTDADLVMLVRHLGCGALVHQPVQLSGQLPADEATVAQLFARALASPQPVPVLGTPTPLEPAE